MKVRLKLFATFRRYLPPGTQGSATDVEVPSRAHVSRLLAYVGLPEDESCVVLVNGRHAEIDTVLREGDVVAVFPAMAGG
jgi:molybdopterin synthase sulfur carrier subunit